MDRTNDPDRRTVLKRLGAAAATSAAVGGAAGTATASEPEARTLEMEPRSVAATTRAVSGEAVTVDKLVETQASNVLALLAEDGLIETAGVDALSTETVDPYTDSSVEGASAYEFGESETRRLVTVDTHVESGVIEMSVEPGRDAVIAEFRGDDGSRVLYGDLGNGGQKASLDADDTCCRCCICTSLLCPTGPIGTRICYGPERFSCPFALHGCCQYYPY